MLLLVNNALVVIIILKNYFEIDKNEKLGLLCKLCMLRWWFDHGGPRGPREKSTWFWGNYFFFFFGRGAVGALSV